eukprot:gnl/Ergobibamus_cyprinoides/1123.p1 GENE.gnl/Ergobibamus_cyprinoides/1123~~gnl/Ergobibamus_cyprinoides/1123.p1  ORF type:complete len:290 (+),score=29.95 gnl/Ergobibamus_cyprinoides/1123:205-1074(+)
MFGRGSTRNPQDPEMLSSLLAGSATVTNELLQVIRAREPLHLSTGDPVLGRIVAIRSGQWGVDIGAPRLASLDLSAINLPFQGVRSAADTRNMRAFLREGDVVFAEVERGALNPSASAISGSARPVRLMTRDNRYGKLQHGCLLHVPPELTHKDATMAVTLPADPVPRETQIQVTVGVNGAVWVSAPRTGSSQFASLRQAGAARRSAAQTPSASRASAAVGVRHRHRLCVLRRRHGLRRPHCGPTQELSARDQRRARSRRSQESCYGQGSRRAVWPRVRLGTPRRWAAI